MICLASKVCGRMHITFRGFEFGIAQITPENAHHSQFMSVGERLCDLSNLSRGFVGAKVNRGAHGDCPKISRFFHVAKQNLIELIRKRQQFIVIYFHDERNLVGVLAGNTAQHAERRSHTITAPFDCQLHDIFRIEVLRIRCE